MKKAFIFLFAVIAAFSMTAQTIPNAGMEAWRSNTAGGILGPVFTVHAPISWYGFDSTIVEDGELFSLTLGLANDWKTQLFQESTIVNSGSYSAKLMTLKQDTFGFVGGIMSNTKLGLDIGALTGIGNPLEALTFEGGTPTTLRIMTVSAYVWFQGGIDTATHTMGGMDSGMLAIQAVCTAYGQDSVIGAGFVSIPPGTGFTQVTANMHYTDTVSMCNLVRIIFSSTSALSLGTGSLDSSTLYVDDVSMTGVPQGPPSTGVKSASANEIVRVFPNPASGTIYLSGPQNGAFTVKLRSISGQVVTSAQLSGTCVLDVHDQPAGMYLYEVTDASGSTVQRGQVSITK